MHVSGVQIRRQDSLLQPFSGQRPVRINARLGPFVPTVRGYLDNHHLKHSLLCKRKFRGQHHRVMVAASRTLHGIAQNAATPVGIRRSPNQVLSFGNELPPACLLPIRTRRAIVIPPHARTSQTQLCPCPGLAPQAYSSRNTKNRMEYGQRYGIT